MKLPLTFAALLLTLIAFAPAAEGQTCTCKAPDKSCTPAVTCPNGCTAVCGSKDTCFATCSGSPQVDKSVVHLTPFKIENKTSAEVAAILSKRSGRNIVFRPTKDNGLYNLELNNDHYWEALRYFQEYGLVLVDGTPFYKLQEFRRKLLDGEREVMQFKGRSVEDMAQELSFYTGKRFIVSGEAKPEQRFSIDLENFTLSEMIEHISKQTGVKIEEQK